jgi:hypothetical protein
LLLLLLVVVLPLPLGCVTASVSLPTRNLLISLLVEMAVTSTEGAGAAGQDERQHNSSSSGHWMQVSGKDHHVCWLLLHALASCSRQWADPPQDPVARCLHS